MSDASEEKQSGSEQPKADVGLLGKVSAWLTIIPVVTGLIAGAAGHYWTMSENDELKLTTQSLRDDLKGLRQDLANKADDLKAVTSEAREAEKQLGEARIALSQAGGVTSALPGIQQQLQLCQSEVEDLKGNEATVHYVQDLQSKMRDLNESVTGEIMSSLSSPALIADLKLRRESLAAQIMDAQSRLKYTGPITQQQLPSFVVRPNTY